MTTLQVIWMDRNGSAAVNIPWPQISKDQYSKFNPSKPTDIVSVALTTVARSKPYVFTLSGPSVNSRRELERLKVVIRDAVKNSTRKRGSSRLAWLEADKNLFREYVELVRDGKVIDEEDFWKDKEALLSGFDSDRVLSDKGALTALFADEAEVDANGKVKVKINPEIIHNIFRLYPAVERAFRDNVPERMSEKDFWTKYFRSEYYAQDKGSSANDRFGGSRQSRQTDDMFQRYENEIAVASIGSVKSAHGKNSNLRRSKISSEMDLVSTYNDYHTSEQLESFDVPIDTSSNPVVGKYIRNTNLIVDSLISQESSASKNESGSSTLELTDDIVQFPEQLEEKGPDFIEMPHLHARLDSFTQQWTGDASIQPLGKKQRVREPLSAEAVIAGMSTIFQDHEEAATGILNSVKILNQDQELYIKVLAFPVGFKEVRLDIHRIVFIFCEKNSISVCVSSIRAYYAAFAAFLLVFPGTVQLE